MSTVSLESNCCSTRSRTMKVPVRPTPALAHTYTQTRALKISTNHNQQGELSLNQDWCNERLTLQVLFLQKKTKKVAAFLNPQSTLGSVPLRFEVKKKSSQMTGTSFCPPPTLDNKHKNTRLTQGPKVTKKKLKRNSADPRRYSNFRGN